MTTKKKPILYTQEVLGRHVVLEFAVGRDGDTRPYLGRIREMKAVLLDNGCVETEHLVVFDDGDQVWFDLAEQDRLNSLTWINRSVLSKPPSKLVATSVKNASRAFVKAAPEAEGEEEEDEQEEDDDEQVIEVFKKPPSVWDEPEQPHPFLISSVVNNNSNTSVSATATASSDSQQQTPNTKKKALNEL